MVEKNLNIYKEIKEGKKWKIKHYRKGLMILKII
jgi:hypothetical protein